MWNASNNTFFNNDTSGTEAEALGVIELVVYSLIQIILGAIGTVGNGLIVVIMVRNQPLRTPSNKLFLSLSVTGLITCTLKGTLIWYRLLVEGKVLPAFNSFITVFGIACSIASLLNLFFMSLDRYISVTNALRYETIVTSSRIHLCIVLSWFLPSLIAPFNKINPQIGTPMTSSLAFVIMLLTTILHLKMYIIARRHRKQIAALESHLAAAQNQQDHGRARQQYKAAKTVAVLLGSYVLCWLPLPIVVLVLHLSEQDWKIVCWLNMFITLNSTLNPYMFVMRTVEFKIALKKLKNQILPNGQNINY